METGKGKLWFFDQCETRYFRMIEETILQFNQDSSGSSTTKNKRHPGRACFATAKKKKGVMYNDAFEILVNPYPLFSRTI